jgi:hypothetical protein
MMFKGLMLAALLVCAGAVQADEIVYSGAIAGQGVWFNDDARPSDFEGGVKGAASLSPHISAVGSALFGFEHSYIVGKAGLRFTMSDATNKDFGVGIGVQRRFSSEPVLRPEEWCPDLTIGWKAWPSSPRVILTAAADYGLDSNEASVSAGISYRFTNEYGEGD